jgi:hypothetical protein
MRPSIISRIIQAEVNVICQGKAEEEQIRKKKQDGKDEIRRLSPVYCTTLNFWYGTDKIGIRTYLSSPRTKKVVRVPILSVPYQKLSVG